MASATAVRLSDNTITATLTDLAGAVVTGATGTVTIVDSAGDDVAGVVWPQNLTDAGSGKYTYDIPHTLLDEGARYTAKIQFTSPGNRYMELAIACRTDKE